MRQIILFESREAAERVAGHLYRVEVQNNCLDFSHFDSWAFDLALGLARLDRKSYCCAGQYCVIPDYAKDTVLETYGRIIFLMRSQQVIASVEAFNSALRKLNESVAEAIDFQFRK